MSPLTIGRVSFLLTKYASEGSLIWQRSSSTVSPYGTPADLTVSSSGSVYAVGSKGFYSSTGSLV
jgi:hypothetical protein